MILVITINQWNNYNQSRIKKVIKGRNLIYRILQKYVVYDSLEFMFLCLSYLADCILCFCFHSLHLMMISDLTLVFSDVILKHLNINMIIRFVCCLAAVMACNVF